MSASEKLRFLSESVAAGGDFDSRPCDTAQNDAGWALTEALPQLVALAEAAEASGDYIIGSKFSMEQPFVSERIRDIRAALAALEEALR